MRAPNLVGNLKEGWAIAKALLSFERLHLGSPKQSQHVPWTPTDARTDERADG